MRSCFLNEGSAWTLHRYPWRLIFDKYEHNLLRTTRKRRIEWWIMVTRSNYRCYCLAEEWSWNTWEFSALVSSHNWDDRTSVEGQNIGLHLSSWSRYHNTVLCCKGQIRGTHFHQGALWWYGFRLPCLMLHWAREISIKANIQMMNRGEVSCKSNLQARTSLPSVFSC